MIRGVLFDLDGTLFDRATTLDAFVRDQHLRLRASLGAVPLEAYVARFVELDARGHVRKELVYEQLAAAFGLGAGAPAELFRDFGARYHRHAVGFAGLHEMLSELRAGGVRLGVVTNGSTVHQRATIDALGIGDFFDAVLISEAEGLRKPDPRMFEHALERLDVGPTEAVFVGDHPEVDIAAAKRAGMRAVWKRDPYWGECPSADAAIDSLPALPATIRLLDRDA